MKSNVVISLLLICSGSFSLSLPSIANAQEPVIVTATRTAQTVDDSLASVTVITQDDLERRQVKSVLEALQGVAGVDIISSGGVGKITSLYLRGSNSDHVLVMIDGIKIGSATLGSIAFQDIPVSQIERIEIVRGPRSSLYGSEAIGGVIQIFTHKGTKETRIYANAGYGRYNTDEVNAGASGQSGKLSYSLNVGRFSTDGLNARDNNNPDKDGYDNNNLTTQLNYQYAKNIQFNFNLLHAEGNTEFDGFTTTSLYDTDFLQETIGIGMYINASNNWVSKVAVNQSRDETENFTDGAFFSRFNTKRTTAIWQNDLTIDGNNLLTAGIEYQNDEVDSDTSYVETSRHNTGVFVQHQWLGEKQDILVGLRQDDNEAFGNHTTGNIAWGQTLSTTLANKLRLIASYGTAFKAPTFNDLYWPDTGFGGGNANLKPEESETFELALRGQQSWGGWDISLYHTKIENLVSGWPPNNVDKAKIDGLEMRLNTQLAGWKMDLDLSLTDPENKDTGRQLARRATQTFKVDMSKRFNHWASGLTLLAQSHRYDEAANTTRLNGYALANLYGSYAINKQWKLRARIDNLFDKDYETVDGYNNPGKNAFLSIHYEE